MLSILNNQNTCSVVVTFHPDPALPDRLSPITRQVDRLLIVDNGSGNSVDTIFDTLASDTRIEIIRNKENLGLAAALNQGIRWAGEHGYQWVLTMDQDSLAYDSMLSGLADAYCAAQNSRNIAVIGANYVDRSTSIPFFSPTGLEKPWNDAKTVITSGSLVSLEAVEAIGSFRDDLFIDHVDDEFCLRARSKGFGVIITSEVFMEHVIGAPTKEIFFCKSLFTTNAPAARRYYQTRNLLVIAKEYFSADSGWVFNALKVRLKELILMLMFENNKLDKLWKTALGAFDALRGRMGRID
ncbi:MAG: glycosyltransferase family 2 protein [Armatimonadota bacterium]